MEVFHDIKDIFVEAFDINDVNNDQTIVKQLVYIVDKVNAEDIEANTKLMNWSSRKYEIKVIEKILDEITLRQVNLLEKVIGVKTLNWRTFIRCLPNYVMLVSSLKKPNIAL